jgi:hypothetical protein
MHWRAVLLTLAREPTHGTVRFIKRPPRRVRAPLLRRYLRADFIRLTPTHRAAFVCLVTRRSAAPAFATIPVVVVVGVTIIIVVATVTAAATGGRSVPNRHEKVVGDVI